MRKAQQSCHYCDRKNAVTKDHIVPKSRGGKDVAWNIVWACFLCNQSKDAKWPTCRCWKCKRSVQRHRNVGVNRHSNPTHPNNQMVVNQPPVP